MKVLFAYLFYYIGHIASHFGNSELMAELYQWAMLKSVQYDTDERVWKTPSKQHKK